MGKQSRRLSRRNRGRGVDTSMVPKRLMPGQRVVDQQGRSYRVAVQSDVPSDVIDEIELLVNAAVETTTGKASEFKARLAITRMRRGQDAVHVRPFLQNACALNEAYRPALAALDVVSPPSRSSTTSRRSSSSEG